MNKLSLERAVCKKKLRMDKSDARSFERKRNRRLGRLVRGAEQNSSGPSVAQVRAVYFACLLQDSGSCQINGLSLFLSFFFYAL